MSFFEVNTQESYAKESNEEFITTSGIYPVKINFVSLNINENGARSLDFNVEYKNTPHIFYGLKLDNNNGSENFERAIFNRLCIIAGLTQVSEPVDQSHAVGKDREIKNFKVLDDFTDLEVYIRIQQQYSLFNGQIKQKKLIRNFYRKDDKASAHEILTNEPAGVQFDKDMKYASNISYKDGLTEEMVTAYKSNGSTTTSSSTTTDLFGVEEPNDTAKELNW